MPHTGVWPWHHASPACSRFDGMRTKLRTLLAKLMAIVLFLTYSYKC